MRRVTVYSRSDQPLFELSEAEVLALSRFEQLNGEHSLTIETTRQLEMGQRVLMQDDRGIWREYVVYGVDSLHGSGGKPVGTYYCTWSVQPDLMGTRVSRMPGTEVAVPASDALDAALSGTSRWARGTVTNANTGGASMYDTDGWDALSILVENWGGEIDATIEVDGSGVTARRVDLYSQMGEQEARRRFDFGADLMSVRRTLADGPLYCRITPRGKGEETDTGGYGRKITIESVNDGKDYLENVQMVDIAKLPDGSGGWEYPTIEVENPDCETPEELLEWAQSVLDEFTVPRVTYEVDVVQLAREGVDLQGVSLGDTVQVVDRKFGDGLRLSGRVVAMTVDELSGRTDRLTIGYLESGLSGLFGSLDSQITQLSNIIQNMNGGSMSTADYLSRLLERINAEINATGGYTYITEGQGIRTYDRPVLDPEDGREATAVTEVKGGTIRIAASKTAQGEWDWKTVFTDGHVAAAVVTAANIVTGAIGNPSGTYWNLDAGQLRMGPTTMLIDSTLGDVLNDVDGAVSDASSAISTARTADSNASSALSTANATAALVRMYGNGVLVCRPGNTVGALVNAGGSFDVVSVTWNNGVPTAGASIASFGEGIELGDGTIGVHIGKLGSVFEIAYNLGGDKALRVAYTPASYSGGYDWTMEMDFMLGFFQAYETGYIRRLATEGYPLVFKDGSRLKHWNGSNRNATSVSALELPDSLTVGARESNSTAGAKSISVGDMNNVSGRESAAVGYRLIAQGAEQLVVGEMNVADTRSLFIVGYGSSDENIRRNAFTVDDSGNAVLAGRLTQNSDRRLKSHLAYLGRDGYAFIRRLRPAVFMKDGQRHYGFYAQDVQAADPWDTATVEARHTDDSLGFDPLTLDYTALIAPLVAYAQSLEDRIVDLEARLSDLE